MTPKISFMMLLYNGLTNLPEGMLAAAFRQVQDIAHEIYVIEGATWLAKFSSPDGRSTDGTVEFIHDAMRKDRRIKLIQRKGPWSDKNQMVCATNNLFEGDYVWQLDSDEFYHENDIPRIVKLLEDRQPFEIDFYSYVFWGGYADCITERTGKVWINEKPKRRIFRNKPGVSFWTSHNPPSYHYDETTECSEQANMITRDETLAMGMKIYHYSYVTRAQAEFKSRYYLKAFDYAAVWDTWQKNKSTPLAFGATTEPFPITWHPAVLKGIVNV